MNFHSQIVEFWTVISSTPQAVLFMIIKKCETEGNCYYIFLKTNNMFSYCLHKKNLIVYFWNMFHSLVSRKLFDLINW